MTENTAPEVTPETPETEAAKLDESILSEMAAMALSRVKPDFERVTEIVAEQNKTGDIAQVLSDAIENSKKKDVVELRKRVEEANAFIIEARKSMEAAVKPTLNLPTEEDLAKLDAEYKAAASRINTYNGVFEAETLQNGKQYSVYDFLGNLPGKKRGAKTGQGEGSARPRVRTIEITTDLAGEQGWKLVENKEGKSTFSVLAQFIKSATDGGVDLPATDYSDNWVAQNGGKTWQDVNDLSTFHVSATGEGGKTYDWNVRVVK